MDRFAELGRIAIDDLGADILLQANEIRHGQEASDDRHLCTLIAE